MDLLERKPGSNKNQIGREIGLSDANLYHHLEKLENAACITILPADRGQEHLCFRVEDANLWLNERTRLLFGRDPKRNLAIYITENPGETSAEIADALRCAVSTVQYHLRSLMDHGLVERHRAGRTHVYEPTWGLERWVEKVADGFDRPWETSSEDPQR